MSSFLLEISLIYRIIFPGRGPNPQYTKKPIDDTEGQRPYSEIDQVSGNGREISNRIETADPEEKTRDDISKEKSDECSGHRFPPQKVVRTGISFNSITKRIQELSPSRFFLFRYRETRWPWDCT